MVSKMSPLLVRLAQRRILTENSLASVLVVNASKSCREIVVWLVISGTNSLGE